MEDYRKDELRKNYGYGNYQDKDYLRIEKWIIVHNHIQEKKL